MINSNNLKTYCTKRIDGHSKVKPFSTLFHSPFTFKVKFHYNSRHVGVKLKALVGVKPLKHEQKVGSCLSCCYDVSSSNLFMMYFIFFTRSNKFHQKGILDFVSYIVLTSNLLESSISYIIHIETSIILH